MDWARQFLPILQSRPRDMDEMLEDRSRAHVANEQRRSIQVVVVECIFGALQSPGTGEERRNSK